MEKKVRKSIKKIRPYVPGQNPKEPGVIKMASNENPLGISPKALEAINEQAVNSFIYPDQSCHALKEKLAKKLGLSIQNLIIGNGSDEIMQFIAAAFINAKEEVVISKNTFSTYEFVAHLFDADPVFVDLKNDAYDLAAMVKAITLDTKVVFLCNPNNPTGTIFTKSELDKYLQCVPRGIITVIDEAYFEYTSSPDFPDTVEYVKQGKDIVVLRTFSKIYGLAGLRVGYGIAKPEIIKYLNLTKLPFNVNRLGQLAAAASLDDESFIQKSLKNNREGKEYFYSELDQLKLEYKKTEANFIFLRVGRPADEVFLEFLRRGVIIRPLSSFGMPDAIRITIGTVEQNNKLVAALKDILK
jgi:histidinol-phosphate aminotransferase